MKTLEEKILDNRSIRNKTILSFSFFILFLIACFAGWNWLQNQPNDQGALKPLRTVLNANEKIFSAILSNDHLAKTYPLSAAAVRVRKNGDAGLKGDFDPDAWKLQLIRKPGDTLFIGLEEIRSLPRTEIVFDFKCIEGWSQVTHWAGVKFTDFTKRYGLDEQTLKKYTGLHTPDDQYYVGIDNKSMLHPQTILCYEMNGKPLPLNQGAPLRLIIPVKYGVKHLKRIGTIYFSDHRPPDYWYERGYDYFGGL
ncbi:MAG: molybdopterin-dependent oxidoreductase [Chitinophagaceae bacterium]|nr:molybdopterin-dependent oxidoreductase [Chitinophagaceae bacterium]MBL0056119.1 molybdopterin-dependent oxidoreductase [Chitinophagaceae bacterium]